MSSGFGFYFRERGLWFLRLHAAASHGAALHVPSTRCSWSVWKAQRLGPRVFCTRCCLVHDKGRHAGDNRAGEATRAKPGSISPLY